MFFPEKSKYITMGFKCFPKNQTAWETFGGSAPEMRIMIRKIAICHADKHNRPRGQTIYHINQRLSFALQQGVRSS